MGFRTEKPTKAFGAPSRSQKKDRTERTKERHAKARDRWALAKALASFPGSLNEKRSFVIRAMAAGLIERRPVPARETIRELVARWERGEQTVEHYYDAPRSGRPRAILPDAFERDIRYVIEAGKGVTAHALTETLQAVAREKGLPMPTYRIVHRRFSDAGRIVRAAARHGARAGELDGLPHAKVATRYAHDAWALDELTVPVYVRIFDDVANCWASARSDMISSIDVFSGACVGYHVVDPSRRRDEWGIQFRSGFDAQDVLATLFSATCRELATDATRDFAGYLPDRLRWDNAQAHRSIMLMLEEAKVELDVRPIRKRRAASNGAVERRVAILKSRCAGIFGHVDDYIPTDRVNNDAAADLPGQRTVAAGYTEQREPRRIPVRPEDLLTVEELRVEIERVVQRYNHEVRNRMHGQTPRARYELARDEAGTRSAPQAGNGRPGAEGDVVTRRVAPGTRTAEVAAAVLAATMEHGRAVTVVEIRAAHARANPPLAPSALDKALYRLEADGTVERAGGRHRRTQWRAAAHPVEFCDPADPAPRIVAAVEALCLEVGRAVETHEVHAELSKGDASALTVDQVRTRLTSLAHESDRKRARTAGEWAKARLRRIAGTSAGGRSCVYWAPLDGDYQPPAVSDASDAVRHAVRQAHRAAGRPVTKREVVLWAKGCLADPAADPRDREAAETVRSTRFRQRLAGAASQDSMRALGAGRIRVVETPLSSRGQYPVRFACGENIEAGEAACLLEDMAVLLRPASELDSIRRLEERALDVGSTLIREIAAARRSALCAAVRTHLVEAGVSPDGLRAAYGVAANARRVVGGWAVHGGVFRPVETLEREMAGFLDGEISTALRCVAGAPATISAATGVPLDTLEALAQEALQIAERDVAHWTPVLSDARRTRGPVAGGISSDDEADMRSFVDRPDAARAATEACYLPRLGAAVAEAHAVLGFVLRDGALLLDWIRGAWRSDAPVRQALVVALGLLGSPAPLELAWPDPADPDDAIAYGAAVALGVDGEGERVRLLSLASRRAKGSACDVAENAFFRAESGLRLATVE
jgi:hypothetical protein